METFEKRSGVPNSQALGPKYESRAVGKIELRDNGTGKMPTAFGYAAVFNELSQVFYDWREKILPGAFMAFLARGDDCCALVDHDSGRITGRRSSGTLMLTEDAKGLYFENEIPDNNEGRDLVTSIMRGDLKAMSFGFICMEDEWNRDPAEGDMYIRSLKRVDIIDVSYVAYPAYPQTEVGLRSLAAQKDARAAAMTGQAAARLRLAETEARAVGAAA